MSREMETLTTMDELRAEVAALRVVVQRILGYTHLDYDHPREALDDELGRACRDIAAVAFTDLCDEPSTAQQRYALHILHQIYSTQVFSSMRKLNS
jgi:hypothetical protein